MLVYTFVGNIHLWTRVTYKMNEDWSPMNNDDSTVSKQKSGFIGFDHARPYLITLQYFKNDSLFL